MITNLVFSLHKLITIEITNRCCHRTQTDLLVQMGSSRLVETWKMLPLITDKNGHLKKKHKNHGWFLMKMGHVIQVWGKPSKLLFRVKDHGDEWRSRHVLSAPPHLGIVGCHTLALQAHLISPRSDSRRARWARTCRGSSGPSDSPSASPHGTRPLVLGSSLSADQHQHRECRR